ncbi:MAG: Ribosomal RNA small subunit methyltransferase E [Bacteroidetes bacterium ADurb.Bin408]|nr:MAG: Ribosomal RNA small subunit methyltransferase E [Bacteroidetes bacterium ADurb.Bin408]
MHLFFSEDIAPGSLWIEPGQEEARHLLRTLRLKKGDVVYFTDGKGFLYTCEIFDDNLKSCKLKITATKESSHKKTYPVHIACALTKNPARIEFFMEKATEIGIDIFTPVIYKHSERIKFNTERLKKVAVSALKQSQNLFLPAIGNITAFNEFVNQDFPASTQKFLCHQEGASHLQQLVQPDKPVVVMIGPEGDFDKKEIALAKKASFQTAHLGSHRLRTETAALLACSIINLCNA